MSLATNRPSNAAATSLAALPRTGRVRIMPIASAARASVGGPEAPMSDTASGSDEEAPLLGGWRQTDNSSHCDNSSSDSDEDGENASLQERLAHWLERSGGARAIDAADAVLNGASVCIYVAAMQTVRGVRGQETPPDPPPRELLVADVAVAGLLVAVSLVGGLVRGHGGVGIGGRVAAALPDAFAWATLGVALLSLVPTGSVAGAFGFAQSIADGSTGSVGFDSPAALLFPLRFWRLRMALDRCLRPGRHTPIRLSPAAHKSVALALAIAFTLLTVTALVHACLRVFQRFYDLTFFDVFYTIAVSSTSGLSTQIVPDNMFSRIVTLYVMIVGAIFIPTNLSELIVLIRSQSKYNSRFRPDPVHPLIPPCCTHTKPKQKPRPHVIVIGNFQVGLLRDFFREFFSEDHGLRAINTRVVMLNPEEPSEELQNLLNDPLYVNRIQYVKGSAMSFHSLNKVHASTAHAVFILSSRSSPSSSDPNQDDAKSVMRALAIRRYNSRVKILAQIILPSNKPHLLELADHILCIDEFIMGMLAQNCLAPGFSTLMYVLTTSISDSAISNLGLRKPPKWMHEYFSGATMEIYAVRLSDLFKGIQFSKVVSRIYMKYGAILFALGFDPDESDSDSDENEYLEASKPSSKPSPPHRIVFNPQSYMLQGSETAYLITKHSRIAKLIASGSWLNQIPGTSDAELPYISLNLDDDDVETSRRPSRVELPSSNEFGAESQSTKRSPFMSPEQVDQHLQLYLSQLSASQIRDQAMKTEPVVHDIAGIDFVASPPPTRHIGITSTQNRQTQEPGVLSTSAPAEEVFMSTKMTDESALKQKSVGFASHLTRSVSENIDQPMRSDATQPNVDVTTRNADEMSQSDPSSVALGAFAGITQSVPGIQHMDSEVRSRASETGSRAARRRVEVSDELIVIRSRARAAEDATADEDPPTAEQLWNTAALLPSDDQEQESAKDSNEQPQTDGAQGRRRNFLANIMRTSTTMTASLAARGARSAQPPISANDQVVDIASVLTSGDSLRSISVLRSADVSAVSSAIRASSPLPYVTSQPPNTTTLSLRRPNHDANGIPTNICNHIVICSLADEFPSNLAYFIAPFRHKDQTRPIVVLCSTPPPTSADTPDGDDERARLVAFRHVYFVTGTPMKRRDLRRAYIDRASRAVVLANPRQQGIMDRSADASTLLAVLNIQAVCNNASVAVETQQSSQTPSQQQSAPSTPVANNRFSMFFMSDRVTPEPVAIAVSPPPPATSQQQQQSTRPQKIFVTAELIHRENMKFIGSSSASVAGTHASRAGIRTSRTGNIRPLTTGVAIGANDMNDIQGQNSIPSFLGGHVFSQSLFHSVMCQTYYNEHLLRVLRMFLFNGIDPVMNGYQAGRGHVGVVGGSMTNTANSSTSNLFVPNGVQDTPPRRGADSVPTGTENHGNFYQAVLPNDGRFVGIPYGSLFTWMLVRYQAVCIGLYRRIVDEHPDEHDKQTFNDADNEGDANATSANSTRLPKKHRRRRHDRQQLQIVKYVVVNPEPDLLIQEDDAVYLLAAKPPQWDPPSLI